MLESEAERDVLTVFEAVRKAMLANDAQALDAHVAHDYEGSDAGGRVHDRRVMLEAYGPAGVHLDVFETSGVSVRSWPGTALVTGNARIRGTYGADTFEHDLRFLDVYACRDGAWRLAASHATDRADR